MAIAQRALAEWNDATAAWLRNSPARWMVPSGLSYDAPPREREWRATELRTAGMLTALTVYIIPAILGLLGACAYVLRQFNAKIEASSLDTSDKLQGLVRVFLGLVVGGLVGIVFLPSGTEMQGVRLSIAALAFLAGYAVQVVFELLDWFVERGSRAMRERLPPPMAQPAPPSPAPVAASRGGGRGATVLVTPAAGGGGTNDNAAADPGSAPAAAPGGAALTDAAAATAR
jgi:hypothetical protein